MMHSENPTARAPREFWLASLKSGLGLCLHAFSLVCSAVASLMMMNNWVFFEFS
uniref:Uncharacterized protein n=1 Tax=Anguilla anguilla TaxID=7936 RepID=A0A0E9RDP6_ANGAN